MIRYFMFVKELPVTLLVGWIIAAGWMAAQAVWYRRARIDAPAVLAPATAARPAARRRRIASVDAQAPAVAVDAGTIMHDNGTIVSGSVLGLS